MNKLIKFGEDVEGYEIPVLNEREIRAAAGILFVLMFIAVIQALQGDFLIIKYALLIFFSDITVRVFINPKYSPSLIIGRLIVSRQTPEYVGAKQKKFAWVIGVVLGAITLTHVVILNAFSPISGIICLVCLVFLFFEAAFGICLGCKFYPLFFKEKAQYCPGEACSVNAKHEIQKITIAQILVVIAFIACLIIAGYYLNNIFIKEPHYLFG